MFPELDWMDRRHWSNESKVVKLENGEVMDRDSFKQIEAVLILGEPLQRYKLIWLVKMCSFKILVKF